MKNYFLLLSVSIIILLSGACSPTPPVSGYTIKGNIQGEGYEGKYVFLQSVYDPAEVYDSCLVANGKFAFADTARIEEPYMQMLILRTDSSGFDSRLPVVIENGAIKALLGDIVCTAGTTLNDKLQDFLIARDKVSDAIIVEKKPVEEVQKLFADVLYDHILKNKDNQVGIYIFKSFQSRLTEEQKQQLLAAGGTWFTGQVNP